MAANGEEILNRGEGPVEQTWADSVVPATPQGSHTPEGGANGAPTATAVTDTANEADGAAATAETSAPDAGTAEEPLTGVENVRIPTEGAAVSTDMEHETPGAVPEQQRADATAGLDGQIKTIRDWMEAEENRPETAQERRKRERMEKSKRIIAAVSDGISALSNLYYTTQYAPNMYNHEKGNMTDVVDARTRQLKAERERKRDQHMNFALKLGDLMNQRAATLRELEAQQERQRLAREKAQREAERHGWEATLQPDKQREQAGKATKAEQEAITAQAVAEYAPELQRKKGATEDARAASYRASAGASGARAAYYRGSTVAKKHHFQGREYVSEKDYAKDVAEAARLYNERHVEEVEVDDGKGGKKKERRYKAGFVPIVTEDYEDTAYGRRRKARNPEEYAGEVESRLAEEAEDNTPPSRRNNSNNTPPSRR